MPPAIGALRSPAVHRQSARTPSPNYFGLTVDPASDPRDSGIGPRDNWSPPTSSIRSLGAQSPQHVPLDANTDFESFRRQTEMNNGFSLGHGNLSYFSSAPSPTTSRPKADGKLTGSDISMPDAVQAPQPSKMRLKDPRNDMPEANRMEVDDGHTAYASSGSKRQSQTIMNAPSFFDLPRQQSPAGMNTTASPRNSSFAHRNIISRLDDRHPRLSLPLNKVDPPSPHLRQKQEPPRADTLPLALEDGPAMISVVQFRDIMAKVDSSLILLLDLRVAPQYAQSRIKGALNLCIPTTLLKRPSFNLEKLSDTFKIEEEKERFSRWKQCQYIIVYDARSSDRKDATSATNTLKKFSSEHWNGQCCILRGGFAEFSQTCPSLVDYRSSQEMHSSPMTLSLGSSMPNVAPVAGGCEIPATKNPQNPFFSNIRQNMDLVGGVGQISVERPSTFSPHSVECLPRWLQKASSPSDEGKTVADKFLHIEQDELSRMQKALSSRVSYGTPQTGVEQNIQIAGFEKGGKNRYNNIWPFEHSRVRLQGRPETACDYVNASHIKASWSNKCYIASQGPLPATFEDFWSMIWDHDVRVIVMLTAESEGGQLKCHPYWAAKEFGTFQLKALSEKRVSLEPHKHRRSSIRQDSLGRRRANTTSEAPSLTVPETTEHPYVIVRKFTLSHSSEPFKPMREITQLHYSSWPDFGAPAQPSHLLGLVELSNSLQRAALSAESAAQTRADDPEPYHRARPVLVHCSAGCGRTGTFCTVDSVIDMLKRQRKEHRSGVTPMELSSVDSLDYSAQGKTAGLEENDWIFDQEVDLIQKTVEDFRKQRISMVQSLRQYVLCYETALEWLSQQSGSGRSRSGSEPRG
ncbi:MAG: hypothetical protein M1818_005185 [Claussenomyces sp. TS43310]|nr:MAG: hypothetical protein M1818_005185 [Claussenomyces sp. TS43310]